MRAIVPVMELVCLVVLLPGCSERMVYGTLQANQRNQCWQYADSQRQRCLEAAEVGYDEYSRQR